jgi:flavorubredoxin
MQECLNEPELIPWLTEDEVGSKLGEGWYEPGNDVHQPINAFLFVGEDESLLFDTMSRAAEEHVITQLREVLGDDGLDYVVISHDEVAHAGNSYIIKNDYPDSELLGAATGSSPSMHHLEEATQVEPGTVFDLGGYEIEFVEPVIQDTAPTAWILERSTNTLFTVDSFSFPHFGTECQLTSEEMDSSITSNRMLEYHARSMQWLPYVDPTKLESALDELIERYDPDNIAPGHGNVLIGDAEKYKELVKSNVRWALENGTLTAHTQQSSEIEWL